MKNTTVFNSSIKSMEYDKKGINMKLNFTDEEFNSVIIFFQNMKRNKLTKNLNIEDFTKEIVMKGVINGQI